jgi:hypothetical protein
MPMAPHVLVYSDSGSKDAAARAFIPGDESAGALPGFAVTTKLTTAQSQVNSRVHPSTLQASIACAIQNVELATGRSLGDPVDPLFLEIAPDVPTDTRSFIGIRYLGVTDWSMDALSGQLGSAHRAWDCHRRFLQNYGAFVLGIDRALFTERLSLLIEQRGVADVDELSPVDLQILVGRYRDLIEGMFARPFVQDPYAQLWNIIGVAFRAGPRSIWGHGIAIRAMSIGAATLGDEQPAPRMGESVVRSSSRQEDLLRH